MSVFFLARGGANLFYLNIDINLGLKFLNPASFLDHFPKSN
jgi:hypothetical protein